MRDCQLKAEKQCSLARLYVALFRICSTLMTEHTGSYHQRQFAAQEHLTSLQIPLLSAFQCSTAECALAWRMLAGSLC